MTGILGGTFDPPHFGHLLLGEEARLRFRLDKVLFVPSRVPPHKPARTVSRFEARRDMLDLAVQGNDAFEDVDLEGLAGSSYTCDILAKSLELYGPCMFVMGMDSLVEMPSWKDFPRLLDVAPFAAGTRPGWDAGMVDPRALGKVVLFEFPGLHVSSTEIRERFARGGATRYLIPDQVRDYALRERLYG